MRSRSDMRACSLPWCPREPVDWVPRSQLSLHGPPHPLSGRQGRTRPLSDDLRAGPSAPCRLWTGLAGNWRPDRFGGCHAYSAGCLPNGPQPRPFGVPICGAASVVANPDDGRVLRVAAVRRQAALPLSSHHEPRTPAPGGLRDAGDPLAIVAADFAKEARVICFDEFFVSDIADAMLLGRFVESLMNRASRWWQPPTAPQRISTGVDCSGNASCRPSISSWRTPKWCTWTGWHGLPAPGARSGRDLHAPLDRAPTPIWSATSATSRRTGARPPGHRDRPADPGPAPGRGCRLVRLRRALRRAPQPGGLHPDRPRLPDGDRLRRTPPRRIPRECGAPLHRPRG